VEQVHPVVEESQMCGRWVSICICITVYSSDSELSALGVVIISIVGCIILVFLFCYINNIDKYVSLKHETSQILRNEKREYLIENSQGDENIQEK
jgi:hypothetical protein